ncbi:phosphatase PAP2 family protein [Pseudoalteromonas sp. MMG010]|uniref:phosphatase PAP2 family protein n=1 Tax=Pseudoalteromonas sp. MMG010 TaxID=2822685 RepID=UPI001B3A2EBB|nr:phosphatase PAP2 family protein [Pseudoalteromonas sp. MMG010]MBQ4832612.1 phosphatase PAP2 family protein [Pseudoalteromonas sp. MMG010]
MTHSRALKRVAQLDQQLFLTLFNGKLPWWLKVTALCLSKSGNGGLYLAGGLLFWWFNHNEHLQLLPSTLLLGFLMERPIYFFAKKRFARIRPCDYLVTTALIVPSDKFSLPSGHSAAAFLVAIILAAYVPAYSVLWFSWAASVACSRVILGVHFPADIIIGSIIGSTCGLCALLLLPTL